MRVHFLRRGQNSANIWHVCVLRSKTHKRFLYMNAFQFGQDQTMCTFSAYVAFNKATHGQTDIKHGDDDNLAECQCQGIVLTSFLSRGDPVWTSYAPS